MAREDSVSRGLDGQEAICYFALNVARAFVRAGTHGQRGGIAAPAKGSIAFSTEQWNRKLLQPGWAGDLADFEVEFIQRELKRHPHLRRKWGYSGSLLRGVPIPSTTIRGIAAHGLN